MTTEQQLTAMRADVLAEVLAADKLSARLDVLLAASVGDVERRMLLAQKGHLAHRKIALGARARRLGLEAEKVRQGGQSSEPSVTVAASLSPRETILPVRSPKAA